MALYLNGYKTGETKVKCDVVKMQCLAIFGIYNDLQMMPQEAHHVTLCPQWKIVLNAMIESRLNEL